MGSSTRPPPLDLHGTENKGQDFGSPLSFVSTSSTYHSPGKSSLKTATTYDSSLASEALTKPRSSKKDKKSDSATSSSPTGSYYTHYGRHTNEWLFHGYGDFASRIWHRSSENDKRK